MVGLGTMRLMKYHHSVLLILTVAKSYEDMRTFPINSGVVFIYPWRACAARATVVNPLRACARGVITAVVLCVCVCLCVCLCVCVCVWGGGGGDCVEERKYEDSGGFCRCTRVQLPCIHLL